ncbi:hypothetical protein LEP1GSC050_1473 [Leptospira broomii serovar Hurstbridge str. 5399]|uniref:Uncharacterized protein n=1 Tax=Leptospira broomii serovar Hurstbridge str. 5399 TaxID=1049789 RepID=T0EXQ2_9LEPT|nr:hypothetical protein LEP1GSC050_1473 [Leptospira broomii serovar Hurstbridge str. 5399]
MTRLVSEKRSLYFVESSSKFFPFLIHISSFFTKNPVFLAWEGQLL